MTLNEWKYASPDAREVEWGTLTEANKTELRERFGQNPLNYDPDAPEAVAPDNATPMIARALSLIGWLALFGGLTLGLIAMTESRTGEIVWIAMGLVSGLLLIGLAKIIELLAIITKK